MGVFVFHMVSFVVCCIGCSCCLFQIVFGFSRLFLKCLQLFLVKFSLLSVVFGCFRSFRFVFGDVADVLFNLC